MKKFIFLFLLTHFINVLYGQPENIYYGYPIDITEMPWQVSIKIDGGHKCGGSIISDQWIVTAAHCLVEANTEIGLPVERFTIHAGATDVSSNTGGQILTVSDYVIHPDFQNISMNPTDWGSHDIAVLKLSTPLILNEKVLPVRMGNPDNFPRATIEKNEQEEYFPFASLTGWGKSEDQTMNDDQLMRLEAPIITIGEAETNNSECEWEYPDEVICFDEHNMQGEQIGAGQGDSGGPATFYHPCGPFLIGATKGSCPDLSSGEMLNRSSIYTSVYDFSDWIESTILNLDATAFDDSHYEVRIEEDVTWHEPRYIFHTIELLDGATLELNADLNMAYDSEIIVKNGGTLKVNGSVVSTCETGMWKGIRVEDGGTLIMDDSNLYNAHKGIDATGNSVVQINDSNFEDCYYGLSLSGTVSLVNLSATIFKTVNGMLPNPYGLTEGSIGFAGISAINNKPFFIYGGNTPNTFENLRYGIKTEGTNFLSFLNDFKDIESSGIHARNAEAMYSYLDDYVNCNTGILYTDIGGKIYASNFDVINNGVYARRGGNRLMKIDENFISAERAGIRLFQGDGLEISNNTIQVLSTPAVNSSGISLSGYNNSSIFNNLIESNNTRNGLLAQFSSDVQIAENTISSLGSTDVGIHLGATLNAEVRCNEVNDNDVGLIITSALPNLIDCNNLLSVNTDVQIGPNSVNQMVRGNTFNGLNLGLEIRGPIGIQPHHGNEWPVQVQGYLGAFANGLLPNEIDGSQFEVDFAVSDANNENWYPQDQNGSILINPVQGWFDDDDALGSTHECMNCVNGVGSDLANWINNESGLDDLCRLINGYAEHSNSVWIRKFSLYYILKNYVNPQSYTVCMTSFIADIENNEEDIVTLHDLLELISDYNEEVNNAASEQLYINLGTEVDLLYQSYQSNDTLNIATYMSQVETSLSNIKIHYQNHNSAQLAILQTLNNILTLWTPTDNYSQNVKDVLSEYVHLFTFNDFDNYVLPAVISTVASYCPEDYGLIVHAARSIESMVSPVYHDDSNCTYTQPRREDEREFINETIIHPNPVTNFLNIESDKSMIGLSVLDSSGKILKKVKISGFDSSVDISDLTSGMKFIEITYLDGRTETHKFIIIK